MSAAALRRDATSRQRSPASCHVACGRLSRSKTEIAGALESRPWFLLQAVADEAFERTMDRSGRAELRGLVVHDRAERVGRGAAPERWEPGQHLVQDRSETEDVRPMIRCAGRGPVPATCRAAVPTTGPS